MVHTTFPKVNMSPEKWCSEEDPFVSPFQNGSFFRGMLIFGGVLERCSIDAFLPIPLSSNVHPNTLGFRNIMLFLVPSRMGWFNYIINGFLLIAYIRVWNEN